MRKQLLFDKILIIRPRGKLDRVKGYDNLSLLFLLFLKANQTANYHGITLFDLEATLHDTSIKFERKKQSPVRNI